MKGEKLIGIMTCWHFPHFTCNETHSYQKLSKWHLLKLSLCNIYSIHTIEIIMKVLSIESHYVSGLDVLDLNRLATEFLMASVKACH